jgi:hypothetical protein
VQPLQHQRLLLLLLVHLPRLLQAPQPAAQGVEHLQLLAVPRQPPSHQRLVLQRPPQVHLHLQALAAALLHPLCPWAAGRLLLLLLSLPLGQEHLVPQQQLLLLLPPLVGLQHQLRLRQLQDLLLPELLLGQRLQELGPGWRPDPV